MFSSLAIIFTLISLTSVPPPSEISPPLKTYEKHHIIRSERPKTLDLAKPIIKPKTQPTPSKSVSGNTIWDRLAACESGGRWDYNGASGFDGGIQFLPSTWTAMDTGYTYAWQAPREVQIAAGKKLQAQSGWGQWPACAAKLGLL